ncbi:serine/threonine-protein phosphatase 6 regulatory ankyrin repeat subunit B-like [Daphnia pulicaria]|uniref:serine/threonine-protein phosphatase 6 regulatory ankyrin repeat subunit B-like n=1 Tax=Daphnia pulicaria TaxID=35523 RepID=UPI001EEACDA7|nr:serine/threonine-protein phosphatase 6 regulatory ankyrin repeat subunit B-like [Daphnia pulicaria]
MWSSGSTSSDLAKGKEFVKNLLYVQHVDKEKDTTSEIPELFLLDYILQDKSDGGSSSLYSRRDCHLNVTSNSASQPNSNLDILKSALKNRLLEVSVYSNPLPIRTPLERYSVRNALNIPSLPSLSDVAIHAFVVFKTMDTTDGSNKIINWWSIEKNGRYIILQQSLYFKEVSESVYDVERRKTVRRLGPVKELTKAYVNNRWLKGLFASIWDTDQLNQPYHLFTSNCQIFASFIFENTNDEGKKWSTLISGIVDSFGRKKETIRPVIDANTIKYHRVVQDSKYPIYKALIEKEDLPELKDLLANYGTESINERDSQGYTLLEWAQAFTRRDVKMHLLEKGAVESELFHRNVFFIALQYWNYKKKDNNNLKECVELDYTDVNQTGDTAVHLALHGAKWPIVKRILSENYANSVNSLGEIPLHIAAKSKGKIGLFKKILNQTKSESVDKVDKDGFTPLHWAIFVNPLRSDKIKLLLDKGANINAQDTSGGNTPLHFALMLQSITVTEILLKYISKNVGDNKFLDVNIQNNDEQTALHWAAAWPDIPVDLFKLILGKSTDINAQDNNKDTPLHAALMGKSKTATKQLLKLQAVDVNKTNIDKKTATHLAALWSDIPEKLFKLILEKSADINASSDCVASYCRNCHRTPLHMALGSKSAVATRELLKHVKLLDGKYVEDVDVNAKDGHEQTALYWAAMWAQIPIELFTIILNKSIDINAKSKCENTPLSIALWSKSETATRQLLKHIKWVDGKYLEDVDVDIKLGEGDIALHLAAQWTDIPGDLFKWILQKSTNVNAQNKHGNTPLHFALWYKSKTATEELLKCDNLDANAKGFFNNATALHLATSWPDIPRHCFRTILEKTADINATNIHGESPLLLALVNQSVIASEELLGRLLLEGQVSGISAEINLIGATRNEYDATALHYAVRWPDIPEDIFKKVLHQSIDINAKTKCGDTPLHSALFYKSKTATEQLLKHVKCVDGREMEDVDVNIKWLKGNAALHLAVRWSDIPLDLLKGILEKTTDVNAPNDDGETPLNLADECKLNKEAFKLLQHRVDSTV